MDELGRFADTPLELRVEIGRRGMAVRDVLNLGPGSLLVLPCTPSDKAEILAAGIRLGRGEPLRRGGRLKIRITELNGAA